MVIAGSTVSVEIKVAFSSDLSGNLIVQPR